MHRSTCPYNRVAGGYSPDNVSNRALRGLRPCVHTHGDTKSGRLASPRLSRPLACPFPSDTYEYLHEHVGLRLIVRVCPRMVVVERRDVCDVGPRRRTRARTHARSRLPLCLCAVLAVTLPAACRLLAALFGV